MSARNWRKAFPPEQGWVRADMTLMSSAPMSGEQMKRLAAMGRKIESVEFGELSQDRRRFVAITREKPEACDRRGGV